MVIAFLRSLNGRSHQFAKCRLVAGAFMISFSGVWVKVSHVTPSASAFYRVFLGGIFLLLAAGLNGELQRLSWRHLMLGLLCGFLFAVDLIFYHFSVHYIGPGLGTILPNFQVFIIAVIGAVFLNERVGATAVVSMPIAFGGLFLVVGIGWSQLAQIYKIGVYLGLSAALFYALFLLSLRKLQAAQQGRSIFYVLMVVSMTTAVMIALELLWTGDTFRIPDWQSCWALLALGLLSQALGWILIANALPHIRASLSGLILLLQPALAFIWDVLFFGRPTGFFNWIGVIIVLFAIYLGTAGNLWSRHR